MHRYLPNICECIVPLLSLKRRCGVLAVSRRYRLLINLRVKWINTYDHFINKDPQRPPVYSGCVPLSCYDLGCNVLCYAVMSMKTRSLGVYAHTFGANKRVCPEVSRT